MKLRWADYLSVGNKMIDADHKHLIAMVNRLEDAIGDRDREGVTEAFALLDTFMDIHLRNEEKVSEAIKYPFARNRTEHRQLTFEMRHMIQKLASQHDTWPDNLVQTYSRFLNGWLTDHIIKTDMRMKPTLLAFPYDFKPR